MTTIEAMACGTPAIVYNSTALPEILSDIPDFIVEKHDLKTVIKIINRIINKKYSIEKLENIVKKYEKEKQYKNYIDLYTRLYMQERNK